jgi:hypothetical protein
VVRKKGKDDEDEGLWGASEEVEAERKELVSGVSVKSVQEEMGKTQLQSTHGLKGLIPHRHPLPVFTSLVCDRVHTLHTAIVGIVSETTATSTFYPPHPHLYNILYTPLELTVQSLQDYDLDKNIFTFAPDGRPSIQEEIQSLDSVQTSFAS